MVSFSHPRLKFLSYIINKILDVLYVNEKVKRAFSLI